VFSTLSAVRYIYIYIFVIRHVGFRGGIYNARHLMPKTQNLPNLKITFSIFTVPNTTGSNHLYNTLDLLMMGIVVPEIC